MNQSLTENQSHDSPSIISPSEQLVLTIFLSFIVLSGVIGNLLVVVVMLVSKEHRKTPTNRVVFNLAIADLLFIVCCAPFQGTIYILREWKFGQFVCKSVHCMQYATMLASILILTIMSIERYGALKHPFVVKRYSTVFITNIISGIIWVVSFATSAPWIVLYDTHTINFRNQEFTICYDYWGDHYYLRKWYMLFFFAVGFAIPSIIISIMSCLTATAILKHSKNSVPSNSRHRGSHRSGRKDSTMARRRKVTGVIFAVAILFLICWLPHNIAIMWINFGKFGYTKAWFIFRVFTHIFTYINSVINPFLYALLSDNFKGIFLRLAGRYESYRSDRRRTNHVENIGNKRREPSDIPSENPALTAILREISLLIQKFEQQQRKVGVTPLETSTNSQSFCLEGKRTRTQLAIPCQNELKPIYV